MRASLRKASRQRRSSHYSSPMDSDNTIELLREFTTERDWGQFHSPENLAKSICIEAAELLECFQWSRTADVERVADELADVLTYSYLLADRIGKTPEDLIRMKLALSREKYPIESARGRSTKNDQF